MNIEFSSYSWMVRYTSKPSADKHQVPINQMIISSEWYNKYLGISFGNNDQLNQHWIHNMN